MHRVLMTGAAGKIGRSLRPQLRGVYPVLRLSDCIELSDAAAGEEVMAADLRDLGEMQRVVKGCDAIVHLGAIGQEDEWQRILEANIIGAYNLFEAARREGVKRVVFASTLHVTGFYRCSKRIDPGVPVRPDSRYGVSKAFGETLGRMYADKFGVSCVVLRIGTFIDRPRGRRMLSTWISPRDMTQLVRRSIEAPDVHFEILYGVSGNKRRWWDNPAAERIGYVPQDNSEAFALQCIATTTLRELTGTGDPFVRDGFHTLFQGGQIAWEEFSGDISKID